MVTAKGIGFLVAAVAAFLLAELTQVGWLYLVDAVLWGLIFLSAICPFVGTAFLRAELRIERPDSTRHSIAPSEGDAVQVTLTLRNLGFWPNYVLTLFYECTVAAPASRVLKFFVAQLTSSGQVSMTSVIQAYQRGLHHLGPVVAESSAPFGLFRRRVRLNAPHPVLVYPQVFPLHRLNFAEGLSCAASGTQRSRTGADHVSSRQYLPGDPIRLIHWRNTAKINRLMVKELEDSVDRTLHLLFDATHVWGDGRETTLEYGIKAVASIAHCAVKNQIPVRILGGGLDRVIDTPGGNSAWRGQTPWPQILEDLALVTEGDGSGLAKSLARVPHGGRVVVAVSVADSSGLEALLRASSMLHRPVVILLEGFGEPSLSGGQLRALEGASTETVVCRPGQLHEVLQALEAPSRPFRSPRRHAVPEAAL